MRKHIKNYIEKNIFLIMSIISFFILPLSLIYSTFVDRIAFFLVPLQVYTLTHTVFLINHKKYKKFIYILIVIFYFIILLIWLLFGTHSHHWIPYEIFPLEYCGEQKWSESWCLYFDYYKDIDYGNAKSNFNKTDE